MKKIEVENCCCCRNCEYVIPHKDRATDVICVLYAQKLQIHKCEHFERNPNAKCVVEVEE